MKRYRILVLAVGLCLAAASAFAQTEADFTARPDENGVVITRYKGRGGTVAIPNTIGGKAVIAIGKDAFAKYDNIKSIAIPGGVTSIGEYAFFECYSLVSVIIPAGLASIGKNAFSACFSLASVTIPEGVTSIGDNAFNGCSGLTSVTIPASVAAIGKYAFAWCSRLRAISVLPENSRYKDTDGVLFTKDGKTLQSYPVGNTRSAYAIPAGVTAIGERAFQGNKSLVSVTIPEGVTAIGGLAFWGCTSLASVTIPLSVIRIGVNAFFDCLSLKPEVRADIEGRFGRRVF
jgi:hypothetical protein